MLEDGAAAETVDVIDLEAVERDEGLALQGLTDHVPDFLGEMGEIANRASARAVRGAKGFPDEIGDVGLAASFSFGFL
jgi:hypothetical protein